MVLEEVSRNRVREVSPPRASLCFSVFLFQSNSRPVPGCFGLDHLARGREHARSGVAGAAERKLQLLNAPNEPRFGRNEPTKKSVEKREEEKKAKTCASSLSNSPNQIASRLFSTPCDSGSSLLVRANASRRPDEAKDSKEESGINSEQRLRALSRSRFRRQRRE